MRTLKFLVEGQIIRQDPKCDFKDLVPGGSGCIQAEFSFSKEWLNSPKVIGFYSRLGKEYTPQPLKDGRTCLIPPEALEKRFFKVRVLGRNGLKTNKLEIDQKGG